MATVEFSSSYLDYIAFFNAYGQYGIFGTDGVNTPSGSQLRSPQAKIVLFSGAIPAQPRLMTSSSFSGTLAYWAMQGDLTTSSAGMTSTFTTAYKAAIATGTATWFSLCWYSVTPPSTGGSLQNRIIGTVGTIGSGEDLEMVTTSIVTGNQYRVYNLRITLPSTYTY